MHPDLTTDNVRRTPLEKICERPGCGKVFRTYPCHIREGKGRFCTFECWNQSRFTPVEVRFWKYVEKTDSCWLWTGFIQHGGYGMLWYQEKGRCVVAHRVSWELHFGAIPDGLQVCHHCDVCHCVNPTHLFLGTAADNARDKVQKGRSLAGDRNPSRLHPERLARGDRSGSRLHPEKLARGEENPKHKLTAPDVQSIRQRAAAGGITYGSLAREYGVHPHLIYLIVKRKVWAHVP